MYRPSRKVGEAIWLLLVKEWTAENGAEERIRAEGVKMIAQIPSHNRYDLWIWSRSKAQHPRLRARFSFDKATVKTD